MPPSATKVAKPIVTAENLERARTVALSAVNEYIDYLISELR